MLNEKEYSNFMNKVVKKKSGCWEWTGATDSKGYGKVNLRRHGGYFRASRAIFAHTYGEIPEEKIVIHKCDNPFCVNPEHLMLGTQKDNMQNKVKRGRHNWEPKHGNNFAGKKVMADGKIYDSYSEAGRALGVSDNAVRKRVKNGWKGYQAGTCEELMACKEEFDKSGETAKKPIEFDSFEDARYWARFSGIKSSKEWEEIGRKGLPENIPVAPHRTYEDKWCGWGNFLGTGNWEKLPCSKKPKREIYQFLSMFDKKMRENPDKSEEEIAKDNELQLKGKSIYDSLIDEENFEKNFMLAQLFDVEIRKSDCAEYMTYWIWKCFRLLECRARYFAFHKPGYRKQYEIFI